MEPNKIGKFILKIRKENNLTQQAFADMFGVTYQAVSKWENGKNIPDILILKDISKKFNIDINDLLDGEVKYKNKTKSKYIIASIPITIILIVISTFLLVKHFSNDDFEFKTLSSNCNNFNISGSVAYNKDKSHIYISQIEYCGGDNKTRYQQIECILYESNNNVDKKINSYTTSVDKKDILLEDFLHDLSFHVDNYSLTCKEFLNSNLFLQINAKDNKGNVISYKISLKSQENCYIN